MNRHEIVALAYELLEVHGLAGEWRVTQDTAVSRAGICRYDRKTIGLSIGLLELWPEAEVRDTILHEIAHALAGRNAGHGREWKLIAMRLGARPRSAAPPGLTQPDLPWVSYCPKAGHKAQKSRQPRRAGSCGKCARSYDPQNVLTFHRRGSAAHRAEEARWEPDTAPATAARTLPPQPETSRPSPGAYVRQDTLF